MSGRQTTLSGRRENTYRTIVKDAYTTRDEGKGDTRLEIVVWRVDEDVYLPPSEGREGVEDPIKTVAGNLRYDRILDDALDEIGAGEISRRTGLKSYADEQGGRAASTVRGYMQNLDRLAPKSEGGLPSSHPVKRVLRRYARSQDKGHFEDDAAGDESIAIDPRGERFISGEIDLGAMMRAYKLARSTASQAGFVFAPQEGEPVAVEDNEIIDADEVRAADRPLGDTKAAAFVEKANGATYEYQIDLDAKDLTALNDAPPAGGI